MEDPSAIFDQVHASGFHFDSRSLQTDLQAAMSQINTIKFDAVCELIGNTAVAIEYHNSGQDISELESTLSQITTYQQRLQTHIHALAKLDSELQQSSSEHLCQITPAEFNTLISKFTAQTAAIKRTVYEAETKSKVDRLREEVHAVHNDVNQPEYGDDDDDDDMIVESAISYSKCPVTQGPLTNPVRSISCGHVYSTIGINSFLGNRSQIACPVSGCNKPVARDGLRRHRQFGSTH